MTASTLRSSPSRTQSFLLRPAILLWAVLSLGMMGLVVGDILFPDLFAPLGRFLSHRENLESPEWRAAAGAEPQIALDSVVLVDTDNRVFFFTLRYRSYPIPVLLADEGEPFVERFGRLSVVPVYYRSGELRIGEERTQ